MTVAELATILRYSPVILLDFDGPVCSVFARYPAPQITDELSALASVASPPAQTDRGAVPGGLLVLLDDAHLAVGVRGPGVLRRG